MSQLAEPRDVRVGGGFFIDVGSHPENLLATHRKIAELHRNTAARPCRDARAMDGSHCIRYPTRCRAATWGNPAAGSAACLGAMCAERRRSPHFLLRIGAPMFSRTHTAVTLL